MKNILHLFAHFDNTGECPTAWSNQELADSMGEVEAKYGHDEIAKGMYFFLAGILAQRTHDGRPGADWIELLSDAHPLKRRWLSPSDRAILAPHRDVVLQHFRQYAQEKIRSQPYF